ncbi:Replication-associated recombination protein A [subsurface metagenome]
MITTKPGAQGVRNITLKIIEEVVQKRCLLYDKTGEEHYNIISALHKSMRDSDPDAAIYWVSRMLEAGENPLYVARRLVRFASEDIGNADPQALQVAVAAMQAVHFLGMPEGNLALAQTATYLACALAW